MESLTKRESLLIFVVLVMGIALRCVSLLIPFFTTDQSGIAIEGWNILAGELPIFYYGQTFQGTLEGYLAALLFTLAGSSSPFVFGWLAIFSSALFLIFFFLLVNKIFGKHVALLALLFAAVGPARLMQWGHDTRLHYSLVLVFQSLIFLITVKLIYDPLSPRKRNFFFLLLGLVAGVAWWTNFLNIHTLLVAALFLFIKEPKLPFRKQAYLGLGGFLIGSLPVWIFNFSHDFVTLKINAFQDFAFWLSHLPDFFYDKFIYLFGVPFPDLIHGGIGHLLGLHNGWSLPAYSLISWGFAILFFIALFFFFLSSYKKGKLLIAGAFLSVVAISSGTVFAKGIVEGGDYLLPIIPILLVILAVFIEKFRKKIPILYFSFAFLFVAHNLVQNYFEYHRNFAYFNESQARFIDGYKYTYRLLFETLRRKNINHVYSQEDNYRFNYLGNQKVIFSNLYEENIMAHARAVDGADKVAILTRGDGEKIAAFEATFKALGVEYEKETLPAQYTLFSEFNLKRKGMEPISTDLWKADSSIKSKSADLAFDRYADTRWSSLAPKQAGMWFLLDLGKKENISKISLYPGNWQDYPGGITVEISQDKKKWKEVAKASIASGPFFWDGSHPFYRIRRSRIDLSFAPRKARYIRLTQLGESKKFYWSIAELYVYRPVDDSRFDRLKEDSEFIIETLKKKPSSLLIANHWLSARVKSVLKKKVEVYPSNLFTGDNREINPRPNDLTPLFLTDNCLLVTSKEKEQETDSLLEGSGISADKKSLFHYVMYSGFKGGDSTAFFWAGDHLFRLIMVE